MFVQTVLEKVKIKAEYPTFRFLFMLTGMIGGAWMAAGVRDLINWMWLALVLSSLSGMALCGERFQFKPLRLLPVFIKRRIS
jgi:hypothetical protein